MLLGRQLVFEHPGDGVARPHVPLASRNAVPPGVHGVVLLLHHPSGLRPTVLRPIPGGSVLITTAIHSPAAPTLLAASSSGSPVALKWTAPTTGGPPSGYIIEAGSVSGAANLATLPTGSTATSYSTTGVSAGTYFVRVRATNSAAVHRGTSPGAVLRGR